ncbi:MAG: AMP-binding protein [Aureliella sp.]
MYPELSQRERFPILTPAGEKLLHQMREHPHAPIWNWPNGEQLNEAGLATVQAFAERQRQAQRELADSFRDREHVAPPRPAWIDELVAFCIEEVPFYRRRAAEQGTLGSHLRFENLPSCTREDLSPHVWDFVPDSQPLDELIIFSSSGTTGHPARTLSHPATAACGIPMIESALARAGVVFPRGPEQVALTNVAAYRGAYTTAIVVAYLKEAGCVRVNLHPSAWRKQEDCELYINHWQAPVWLGDPLAFASLESTDVRDAPQAIVSSIMRLSPAYEAHLRERYGCPVFDLYAMTEVGILAMRSEHGHELLPHDVYVEILGDDDQPVPDGVRGEITVTSGRNPFMPLLRYRTGDFASLARRGGRAYLVELEGRSPVVFPLPSGRLVHSMEVTRLMRLHPLLQYRLHQDADGRFHFGYRGLADTRSLRMQLSELLEHPETLVTEELPESTRSSQKVCEYRSDREL